MRRNERLELVEQTVRDHCDDDVSEAILDGDGIGALSANLNNETDGTEDGIADRLVDMIEDLDDDTLDWFTGDTDDGSKCEAPAAFLASRV